MKYLYLVIPVYNGAQYITSTVRELEHFFLHRDVTVDITWVNDGSTDATEQKIAQAIETSTLSMRLLTYDINKGKGHAIKHAIEQKKDVYQYVAFTDVELPYGLQPSIDACTHMDTHGDIHMVVGSRVSADESYTQYHWYRRMVHHIFRIFIPQSIRHYRDTQCGLKVFRGQRVSHIFDRIQTSRWVFDIELFVIATKQGIQIAELPVSIKPSCVTKRGGVSLLKHGMSVARDLFRIYRGMMTKQYE